MRHVIEVQHLRKYFLVKQKQQFESFLGTIRSFLSPSYKKVAAVDNLSFTINEGQMVAFIGPNGAGKSTTIKMLTGILSPSSGFIKVYRAQDTPCLFYRISIWSKITIVVSPSTNRYL